LSQEYIARAEPRGPKVRKVFQAIHMISFLFEKNPQGECRIPPSPKTTGQW
jgi:hypothetical protein